MHACYVFISAAPIEAEILRLEKRRDVLQQEIADTDDMIIKQRQILKETRLGIKHQLDASEQEKRVEKARSYSESSEGFEKGEEEETLQVVDDLEDSLVECTGNGEEEEEEEEEENVSNSNDDLYDEECEMVDIIRQLEPQLLFVLHRGNTDDIILYVPPNHRLNTSYNKDSNDKEIIFLYRLQVYNDMDSAELISSFESQMGFGPKVVSNDKRDDPSALELSYLHTTHVSTTIADTSDNTSTVATTYMADFAYAIELPVLPGVVIDIWKISADKLLASSQQRGESQTKHRHMDFFFATTTIQGIKMVNLQRIFLMVETRWGTIVGIELSGRVSSRSKLLVEVIAQT